MTDATASATISLAKIRPGNNPRRYFDQQKHDELVASFKLRGVLQPMLLRPVAGGEGYEIVAGGRRYRAALEAFGADGEVPVVIRDMTDQEALEAAIDENDLRDDASETEQADAAVRVVAACATDRSEAARRLGWSRAKLDRRLALAELSAGVKRALDERRIKVGHAELLAAVPGDKQEAALDTILKSGIDVAKTRELLMRVTHSLASAVFDKTECTTCPFNSGSQRALFETHVDDGHCTNPGCFQLKTEAAEKAQAPKAAASPAAPTKAVADKAPQSDAKPAKPAGTEKAPTKPDAEAPVPAPVGTKTAVTAETVAKHVADLRASAWQTALLQAVEGDPGVGEAFEATLRDSWQVDRVFLSRLGKDELKFVAQECGLVEHMGEKAFAKLLTSPADKIVAGMLNATGFSWVGRLPGAMTLTGRYGAPLAAPATPIKE